VTGITFARDMEKRFKKTRPGNVATYHGIGLRSNYTAQALEDDKLVDEQVKQAEEAEQKQRDTNDALRLLEVIDAHDSSYVAMTVKKADNPDKPLTAKETRMRLVDALNSGKESGQSWAWETINRRISIWQSYVLKNELFNKPAQKE